MPKTDNTHTHFSILHTRVAGFQGISEWFVITITLWNITELNVEEERERREMKARQKDKERRESQKRHKEKNRD